VFEKTFLASIGGELAPCAPLAVPLYLDCNPNL